MAIRTRRANQALNQNIDARESVQATVSRTEPGLFSATVQRLVTMASVASICCVVAGSTGCTITSNICRAVKKAECIDNFMVGYRNKALAEKAWHCQQDRFCNIRHRREFKDGFISGYLDVASGGAGCCPSMAPRKYWGWKYQSAGGQDAINAWFQGFPMGVQAAEQDGIGHMQQIYINRAAVPVVTPLNAVDGHVPDVTNPFYSDYPEAEFIPAPEGVIEQAPVSEVEIAAPVQPQFEPRSNSDTSVVPSQPRIHHVTPQVDEPVFVDEPNANVSIPAPVTAPLRDGVVSDEPVGGAKPYAFEGDLPPVHDLEIPVIEPVVPQQPVIVDQPVFADEVVIPDPVTSGERMQLSDQFDVGDAATEGATIGDDLMNDIFGSPSQAVQSDVGSDDLPFTFE